MANGVVIVGCKFQAVASQRKRLWRSSNGNKPNWRLRLPAIWRSWASPIAATQLRWLVAARSKLRHHLESRHTDNLTVLTLLGRKGWNNSSSERTKPV